MTEIEWKEQSADLKELFANYTPLKGDTITIWDINGMNQIFNMSECEFLISEKKLEVTEFYSGNGSDNGERVFWFYPSMMSQISMDLKPTGKKRDISW